MLFEDFVKKKKKFKHDIFWSKKQNKIVCSKTVNASLRKKKKRCQEPIFAEESNPVLLAAVLVLNQLILTNILINGDPLLVIYEKYKYFLN